MAKLGRFLICNICRHNSYSVRSSVARAARTKAMYQRKIIALIDEIRVYISKGATVSCAVLAVILIPLLFNLARSLLTRHIARHRAVWAGFDITTRGNDTYGPAVPSKTNMGSYIGFSFSHAAYS